MKSEKLQLWALIAEIAGGIAVVASLLLLVVEIRENTRAVQVTTYDSLQADIANWRMETATDEALREVDFIVFSEGRADLTPEQTRLDYLRSIALFLHYERAFVQWENGNLDDNSWNRFKVTLCQVTGTPQFEALIGRRLDEVTSQRFTEYRNTQC